MKRKVTKGFKKNGKVQENDFNIIKKLQSNSVTPKEIKELTGWSKTVINRVRVNEDWQSYKRFVREIAHNKSNETTQPQDDGISSFEKVVLEVLAEIVVKLDMLLIVVKLDMPLEDKNNKNKKGWF